MPSLGVVCGTMLDTRLRRLKSLPLEPYIAGVGVQPIYRDCSHWGLAKTEHTSLRGSANLGHPLDLHRELLGDPVDFD